MREIKFRAWDDKNKRWLLGYELPNLGGFSLTGECVVFGEWSNCVSGFINDFDSLKIMQFTGLKDKAGVEIYEGDIFRIEEDNITECGFCDGVGTVEGGQTIETICSTCQGTGVIDDGDRIFYVVIVWVNEWSMFCSLLVDEYHAYLRDGVKGLEEPLFWTYTLEDTNSRKHFLCGNIYQHPNLLES